mmetsp:Transcript_31139/g.90851  ORF Transcript_31139/g.90851 Transcript_31139/m.90851 type:complete len:305 (+) Transcript_31139:643-1557(+)
MRRRCRRTVGHAHTARDLELTPQRFLVHNTLVVQVDFALSQANPLFGAGPNLRLPQRLLDRRRGRRRGGMLLVVVVVVQVDDLNGGRPTNGNRGGRGVHVGGRAWRCAAITRCDLLMRPSRPLRPSLWSAPPPRFANKRHRRMRCHICRRGRPCSRRGRVSKRASVVLSAGPPCSRACFRLRRRRCGSCWHCGCRRGARRAARPHLQLQPREQVREAPTLQLAPIEPDGRRLARRRRGVLGDPALALVVAPTAQALRQLAAQRSRLPRVRVALRRRLASEAGGKVDVCTAIDFAVLEQHRALGR